MKKPILFCLLILCWKLSVGQFYDRTWIIGALPMITLTFNGGIPQVGSLHGDTPVVAFIKASSNVSDINGNLLFYCNGSEICDSTTHIMPGGNELLDSLIFLDYGGGFVEPQTNIILPRLDNTFYVFYFSESDSLYGSNTIDEPDRLYYAIVDMNQNNGLGKVTSKKNVAYKGLFGQCRITACRHANGRDWWLVHQGEANNEYFIYLITPDSVYAPQIHYIGPSDLYDDNPGAESMFSPDGSKFVTCTSRGPVVVMDFDRCSGIFSNPDTMEVLNTSFLYNGQSEGIAHGAPGCCFSSNSRFVYINNTYAIWQYDTWASDIAGSAVLIGQWDSVGTGPVNHGFYAFYQMNLLPNGKIIIDNFDGYSQAFHMIDSPNIQGIGCHFTFNELQTSTINATSLPNMINYRLGALTGSGCDTITGIKEISSQAYIVKVYPNPASENLQVDLSNRDPSEPVSFVLYDMLGQEIMRQPIPLYEIEINRNNIAPGIYTWQVQTTTRQTKASGKLVWE